MSHKRSTRRQFLKAGAALIGAALQPSLLADAETKDLFPVPVKITAEQRCALREAYAKLHNSMDKLLEAVIYDMPYVQRNQLRGLIIQLGVCPPTYEEEGSCFYMLNTSLKQYNLPEMLEMLENCQRVSNVYYAMDARDQAGNIMKLEAAYVAQSLTQRVNHMLIPAVRGIADSVINSLVKQTWPAWNYFAEKAKSPNAEFQKRVGSRNSPFKLMHLEKEPEKPAADYEDAVDINFAHILKYHIPIKVHIEDPYPQMAQTKTTIGR